MHVTKSEQVLQFVKQPAQILPKMKYPAEHVCTVAMVQVATPVVQTEHVPLLVRYSPSLQVLQEVALVQTEHPKVHLLQTPLFMKYWGMHWVHTTESKQLRQCIPQGLQVLVLKSVY